MRSRTSPAAASLAASAAVALALGLTAAAASPAPPSRVFRQGYDLCRATSLRAVREAGAQRYTAGRFVSGACDWVRADLRAGLSVSAHPVRVGSTLLHDFAEQNGLGGVQVRGARIAGARRAILVRLPPSEPGQASKDLLALYPNGLLQVNMTAPGSLPAARLVAVLALFAHG